MSSSTASAALWPICFEDLSNQLKEDNAPVVTCLGKSRQGHRCRRPLNRDLLGVIASEIACLSEVQKAGSEAAFKLAIQSVIERCLCSHHSTEHFKTQITEVWMAELTHNPTAGQQNDQPDSGSGTHDEDRRTVSRESLLITERAGNQALADRRRDEEYASHLVEQSAELQQTVSAFRDRLSDTFQRGHAPAITPADRPATPHSSASSSEDDNDRDHDSDDYDDDEAQPLTAATAAGTQVGAQDLFTPPSSHRKPQTHSLACTHPTPRRPLTGDCDMCSAPLFDPDSPNSGPASPSPHPSKSRLPSWPEDDDPDADSLPPSITQNTTTWCKHCGWNFHTACFLKWRDVLAGQRIPRGMECPFCRRGWDFRVCGCDWDGFGGGGCVGFTDRDGSTDRVGDAAEGNGEFTMRLPRVNTGGGC